MNPPTNATLAIQPHTSGKDCKITETKEPFSTLYRETRQKTNSKWTTNIDRHHNKRTKFQPSDHSRSCTYLTWKANTQHTDTLPSCVTINQKEKSAGRRGITASSKKRSARKQTDQWKLSTPHRRDSTGVYKEPHPPFVFIQPLIKGQEARNKLVRLQFVKSLLLNSCIFRKFLYIKTYHCAYYFV